MTLPRPLVTLRLLLVVVLVGLTALTAPLFISPAANTAAAAGSAKTVNGTWHPWKANDTLVNDPDYGPYWQGKYDDGKTPTVTVDRTTDLSDEVVNVTWRNFTPSSNDPQYATLEDGGTPTQVPFRPPSDANAFYGVDVYECRGTHPTKNPKFNLDEGLTYEPECYSYTSDFAQDGPAGPNNAVKAVTQNDGTGSAQLHIENAETNTLLRCSPTQPCSIVVVPNQGGKFDYVDPKNRSTADCDDHSLDYFLPQNIENPYLAEVNGRLSPCSWSKRITIPITFGPIASTCPGARPSFTAVGSPALTRGLGQLLAGWCRGAHPLNFDYNFSVSEPRARSQFLSGASSGFTSDTDVALTTEPADAGSARQRRFVYAPIANNAVSVPYAIDNIRTGRPITDLRLTPRLIAKLLTQSYAPRQWNCTYLEQTGSKSPFWCAGDVRNNPATIFDDPDFQRLNFRGDHPDRDSFPGGSLTPPVGAQNPQDYGSFFPTVAGGDSDTTLALTRWIARDPDAADFLRGRADKWEMRINPNYRVKGGSLYPTTHFEALDPGFTAPNVAYRGDGIDPRTKQGMQGSWTPVASLSLVAANLLRGRSTATITDGVCDDNPPAYTCAPTKSSLTVRFPRTDPEPVGVRDATGVTDNTEAQVNSLPTAELLTDKGTFVGPTRRAMANAAATLRTSANGVTQAVDFETAPADAYPLLLPVYAMVPTCGLTRTKAAGIAGMLKRVVSSQTYGDAPGTLVRGLVKLTSKQLTDTRRAASAVSNKTCPKTSDAARAVDAAKDDGGNGGNSGNAGDGGGPGIAGPGGGAAPAAAAASQPAPGPAGATRSNSGSRPKAAQNVGYRLDDGGGSLSLLPILLLVGGLVLIGGPVGWWALATAPGRTMRDRVRHLVVGAGGWRR